MIPQLGYLIVLSLAGEALKKKLRLIIIGSANLGDCNRARICKYNEHLNRCYSCCCCYYCYAASIVLLLLLLLLLLFFFSTLLNLRKAVDVINAIYMAFVFDTFWRNMYSDIPLGLFIMILNT